MKAYILRSRIFYSYFPTTVTLLRALCRIKNSLRDIDIKHSTIAGPYVYKDNKIYALGGSRLGALRMFGLDVPYVPFESDRPPFYAIVGNEVEIAYPAIPTLLSRVNINRASFTSTGTGRVSYIKAFYLDPEFKLLIVADSIEEDVIRLLGKLGFGRYKTIGGGFFEVEGKVEVTFDNDKYKKDDYALTTLDTDASKIIIGEKKFYRVKGKRVSYYPGGIIKGKHKRPSDKELLPYDCRPENGSDKLLGFPKIVSRSARAPFIIFIQTRGGSSSR